MKFRPRSRIAPEIIFRRCAMKLSVTTIALGTASLVAELGCGMTAPKVSHTASAREFTRPDAKEDKHLVPLNKHLWLIYATDTPESRAAVSPEVWAAHVKFDLEQ